ncbi:hypothetical protein [Psychromonas sp. 14N.309.X.WAT.B.A12]|jgi:hypothetical protein|uniref:hypothetical protein n=1 Tax=unclassified Psychromonas TaxID=2614957 RepID=UPI0025B0084D|nr:hypothetical protein [Psychromonas sp. 14N.309.X.WAT.B.A12]MDN2661947.1 hypothetical protein [Psychromonas sp. 14N.309.X.WAT.B.A12]
MADLLKDVYNQAYLERSALQVTLSYPEFASDAFIAAVFELSGQQKRKEHAITILHNSDVLLFS